MVLAVPSMQEMLATQRVRGAASELLITAQETRSAALKYNRRAVARPVDASLGWQGGWTIYIDNNVNAVVGVLASNCAAFVSSYEAPSRRCVMAKCSGRAVHATVLCGQ
ncbi:MAG: GspH/FimT family pseudopilin [Comamonadaceae bacterium]|uniref:pilus assembly FimT family protein n=1 Tax=Candidatus Skiveiella danica TaxID=3386177 RepID=UPI00390B5998|nr:GspH/FimT family pseudopilin [Comamonadaceae bacterium]